LVTLKSERAGENSFAHAVQSRARRVGSKHSYDHAVGDGTDCGAGIPGCVLCFCIGGSKYSQFGRPHTITVLSASRLGSVIYVWGPG
jgi:hypothetical protein